MDDDDDDDDRKFYDCLQKQGVGKAVLQVNYL